MTKDNLIQSLVSRGALKTPEIIQAFKNIDRKDFLRPEFHLNAYQDKPIPTFAGQNNPQPSALAHMIEMLQPQKGEKILIIGVGTGWSTAIIARLVGPDGAVVGTEIHKELLQLAINTNRIEVNRHIMLTKATNELGHKELAPYDKILLTARANEVPVELLDQLKPEGIAVLPVGTTLIKITKDSPAEQPVKIAIHEPNPLVDLNKQDAFQKKIIDFVSKTPIPE